MPLEPQPTLTKPISVPEPQPQLQQVPGLAKAAPIPVAPPEEAKIVPPPVVDIALSLPEWQGVPVDTILYFGVEMSKMTTAEVQQLKDIDTWAKRDLSEDTIGNRLHKIRLLESKLGAPHLHESRLTKLWNWVKIDFSLNELRKRQSAYEQTGGMREILR